MCGSCSQLDSALNHGCHFCLLQFCAMAPIGEAGNNGGVQNQAANRNRTSSPAPLKATQLAPGGATTVLDKAAAKANITEQTAANSGAEDKKGHSQRLRAFQLAALMLSIIMLSMTIHIFGVQFLTKLHVPILGMLRDCHKTAGMVVCCTVGCVAAMFLGNRSLNKRKEKTS